MSEQETSYHYNVIIMWIRVEDLERIFDLNLEFKGKFNVLVETILQKAVRKSSMRE